MGAPAPLIEGAPVRRSEQISLGLAIGGLSRAPIQFILEIPCPSGKSSPIDRWREGPLTIAACYVTPEGIVLGADSTTSATLKGGFHYFNYNQKVFEIGEPGTRTLGLVTWGLSQFPATGTSHRTIVARINDEITARPRTSVMEVVELLADLVWSEYEPLSTHCRALSTKRPFDPAITPPDPTARTEEEEKELDQLKRGLVLGYFLGGYVMPTRKPEAFSVTFDPLAVKPSPVSFSAWNFAGIPNMIKRLIFGYDDELKRDVLNSGKWNGSTAELDNLFAKHQLVTAALPIRDAIDFVHACIYSTIKAMKFSSLAQACGGPIEIAVITTDRRFRWVRHKEWDAAISEGDA